jgi:hypothetical protein
MQGLAKYLRNLFLMAILSSGGLLLLREFISVQFRPSIRELAFMAVFFFLTTALLHYFSVKINRESPTRFVRFFSGMLAIKLMLYLGVLMFYGIVNREEFGGFAISFLLMYCCFIVFEVIALLEALRKS